MFYFVLINVKRLFVYFDVDDVLDFKNLFDES